MKHVLTLFVITFILMSTKGYSQNTYEMPTDEVTGKIHYQEVVKMEGTKDELYIRAQKWLHVFFPNASSAIERLDQEAGVVEGTRKLRVTTKDKRGREEPAGIIKYTFKIELKDGKYRVRLYDFKQAASGSKPLEDWFEVTDKKRQALYAQIFQQVNADAQKLIASLKKEMRPKEIKTDEW